MIFKNWLLSSAIFQNNYVIGTNSFKILKVFMIYKGSKCITLCAWLDIAAVLGTHHGSMVYTGVSTPIVVSRLPVPLSTDVGSNAIPEAPSCNCW